MMLVVVVMNAMTDQNKLNLNKKLMMAIVVMIYKKRR